MHKARIYTYKIKFAILCLLNNIAFAVLVIRGWDDTLPIYRLEGLLAVGFGFVLSLSFIVCLLLLDLGFKYGIEWVAQLIGKDGVWKRLVVGITHLTLTYVAFKFFGVFEMFFYGKFDLLIACIVVCGLVDLYYGYLWMKRKTREVGG